MMVKKVDKVDTTKRSLIKTSVDIVLVIIVSIIVAFSFNILSVYNEFVRDNDLLCFAMVEVFAFGCILAYKRWRKH